ncbi:hypothetical protein [Nonomuraea sp. NPDC049758]|uniref:hypothetical protein n=1 Tax=Nonomuraea sp. NPDC049758 TaxID=3154360 RepID=UPI003418BC5E
MRLTPVSTRSREKASSGSSARESVQAALLVGGELALVRRGEGDPGVDVHADHPLGRLAGQLQGEVGASAAALRAVPVVAEPGHQLGEGRRRPLRRASGDRRS